MSVHQLSVLSEMLDLMNISSHFAADCLAHWSGLRPQPPLYRGWAPASSRAWAPEARLLEAILSRGVKPYVSRALM